MIWHFGKYDYYKYDLLSVIRRLIPLSCHQFSLLQKLEVGKPPAWLCPKTVQKHCQLALQHICFNILIQYYFEIWVLVISVLEELILLHPQEHWGLDHTYMNIFARQTSGLSVTYKQHLWSWKQIFLKHLQKWRFFKTLVSLYPFVKQRLGDDGVIASIHTCPLFLCVMSMHLKQQRWGTTG